jgi:hypothetical protein
MMNPQSLNRYSYCLNNPLRYTDPTGQFSWGAIISSIKTVVTNVTTTVTNVVNTVTTTVQNTYNTVSTTVATVVNTATAWVQTTAQTIQQAPVNAGKAIVESATSKCEPQIMASQASGGGDLSTSTTDTSIVNVMNTTGAGISNIYGNSAKGYTEVDVSEGGWVAKGLNVVTGSIGGAGGITLPTPRGSLMIIREQLYNATSLPFVRAHEEIHVVQQQVLGASFIPVYFLGNALYGYNENPLEVQAVNYSKH